MAHVLELPHPFQDLEDNELDDAVECFFKHFWWERVMNVFAVAPFSQQTMETTAKTLQREQAEDLLHEDTLSRAAKTFRERLAHQVASHGTLADARSALQSILILVDDHAKVQALGWAKCQKGSLPGLLPRL